MPINNSPEASPVSSSYVRLEHLDEAFAMPEGQVIGEDHNLFLHGREVDIQAHNDGLANGIFERLVPEPLDSTRYNSHSFSSMRIRDPYEVIDMLSKLDVCYQVLRRVNASTYEVVHDMRVLASPGNYVCRAVVPARLQDPFLTVALITLDGRVERSISVEHGINDELTHLTGPERIYISKFDYTHFKRRTGEECWLCTGVADTTYPLI